MMSPVCVFGGTWAESYGSSIKVWLECVFQEFQVRVKNSRSPYGQAESP